MEGTEHKSEGKDTSKLNVNPNVRTMLKRWITNEHESVQRKRFNICFVS